MGYTEEELDYMERTGELPPKSPNATSAVTAIPSPRGASSPRTAIAPAPVPASANVGGFTPEELSYLAEHGELPASKAIIQPQGVPQEQSRSAVPDLAQRASDANMAGELATGLKRGVTQTGGLMVGLGGMVSSVLGKTGLQSEEQTRIDTQKAMEGYQDIMAHASKYSRSVELKDFFGDELTGWQKFKNIPLWMSGTLGEFAPSMGMGLAGGTVGSAVGKKAGGGIVNKYMQKKAVDTIKDQFVKNTMKGSAGKLGKQVAKEEAELLANQYIKQIGARGAAGKFAAQKGAKAGVVGSTWMQESGGMWADNMEKGKDNPLSAIGFGFVAGLVETLGGNIGMVDKLLGPRGAKMVVEGLDEVTKASTKGKAWKALKGVAAVFLRAGGNIAPESMQEGMQEVLGIANEIVNDTNGDEIFSDENMWRVFESAVAGAVPGVAGGVAMGGLGKARQGLQKVAEIEDPTVDEGVPLPEHSQRQLIDFSRDEFRRLGSLPADKMEGESEAEFKSRMLDLEALRPEHVRSDPKKLYELYKDRAGEKDLLQVLDDHFTGHLRQKLPLQTQVKKPTNLLRGSGAALHKERTVGTQQELLGEGFPLPPPPATNLLTGEATVTPGKAPLPGQPIGPVTGEGGQRSAFVPTVRTEETAPPAPETAPAIPQQPLGEEGLLEGVPQKSPEEIAAGEKIPSGDTKTQDSVLNRVSYLLNSSFKDRKNRILDIAVEIGMFSPSEADAKRGKGVSAKTVSNQITSFMETGEVPRNLRKERENKETSPLLRDRIGKITMTPEIQDALFDEISTPEKRSAMKKADPAGFQALINLKKYIIDEKGGAKADVRASEIGMGHREMAEALAQELRSGVPHFESEARDDQAELTEVRAEGRQRIADKLEDEIAGLGDKGKATMLLAKVKGSLDEETRLLLVAANEKGADQAIAERAGKLGITEAEYVDKVSEKLFPEEDSGVSFQRRGEVSEDQLSLFGKPVQEAKKEVKKTAKEIESESLKQTRIKETKEFTADDKLSNFVLPMNIENAGTKEKDLLGKQAYKKLDKALDVNAAKAIARQIDRIYGVPVGTTAIPKSILAKVKEKAPGKPKHPPIQKGLKEVDKNTWFKRGKEAKNADTVEFTRREINKTLQGKDKQKALQALYRGWHEQKKEKAKSGESKRKQDKVGKREGKEVQVGKEKSKLRKGSTSDKTRVETKEKRKAVTPEADKAETSVESKMLGDPRVQQGLKEIKETTYDLVVKNLQRVHNKGVARITKRTGGKATIISKRGNLIRDVLETIEDGKTIGKYQKDTDALAQIIAESRVQNEYGGLIVDKEHYNDLMATEKEVAVKELEALHEKINDVKLAVLGKESLSASKDLKTVDINRALIPERMTVEIKGIREASGEEILYTENAREAMRQVDARIQECEVILECMKT